MFTIKLQKNVWKTSEMGTPSITHTHTHPFNGPLSGTTLVSQYQKGKTNLDFTEARDSVWQWHQLGCAYSSVHLAPDRQPRQHPTTQVFYMSDALPAAQPTVSKHYKTLYEHVRSQN